MNLSTHTHQQPKGFALIATISVMVLLVMIALAMLSLSTLTLRTENQSSAKAEAQANARLALMLAIGEIQKSLGPDQRITARSEVLSNNPAYPLLTGSFKTTRENTPTDPASYFKSLRDQSKLDAVWLVSSNSPVTNPTTDTPASLNGTEVTPMQLAFDQSGNEFFVQAGKIPLKGDLAGAKGAYAWWVDDESQKAKINVTTPDALANGTPYTDHWKLASAQQSNIYRVDTDPSRPAYSPGEVQGYDSTDRTGIRKLLTLPQADIPYTVGTTSNWFRKNETDFTTWSEGLPVDTLQGRLRQDLSLYLETGEGLGDSHPVIRGSAADTGYQGPALAGLNYTDRDMPRFGLIKSWKEIGATVSGFDTGGAESKAQTEQQHGIHPVILRAGIYYAPYLNPDVRIQNIDVAPGTKKPGYYVSWKMAAYPRITIWNPTSVPITDPWFLYQVGVTNHFMLVISGNQGQDRSGAARDNNNIDYWRTFYDPGNPSDPRRMSFFNMMNSSRNYSPIPSGGSGDLTMPLHTYALRLDTPLLPGQTRTFYPENNSPQLINFIDQSSFEGITQSNVSSGNVMAATPAPNNYFRVLDLNNNEYEGKIYARQAGTEMPLTTAPAAPDFLESYLYVRHAESGPEFKGAHTHGCAYRLLKPNQSGSPTLLQEIFSAEHTQSGGTNGFPTYSISNAREYDDPDDGASAVGFSLVKIYEDPNRELSSRRGHQMYISYALEDPESDYSSLFKDESKQFSGFTHYNPRSPHIFPGTYEEQKTGVGGGAFSATVHGIRQELYSEGRPEAAWLNDWSVDSYSSSEGSYGSSSEFGTPGLYDLNLNSNGLVYPLFDYPRKEDGVLSLGELQAVNFTTYPWQPGNAFGNSFADPRVPRDQFANDIDQSEDHPYIQSLELGTNRYVDLSWLLNYSMWDRFFLSTIDYNDPSSDATAGATLRNARHKLVSRKGQTTGDPVVGSGLEAFNEAAANIRVDGAFNVNTTSVAAWKQFLGSNFNLHVPVKNTDSGAKSTPDDQAAFPRLLYPYRAEQPDGSRDVDSGDGSRAAFAANRSLTDEELQKLAEKIVEEVRLRGPFLSVSDFVNRRLVSDTDTTYGEWAGLSGVLQTAIDRTTVEDNLINKHLNVDPDLMFTKNDVPNYLQQAHVVGRPNNTSQSRLAGAPGSLTQADILRTVGPMLTARGDTFRIRAYGESKDPVTGTIKAKAWCEAVVQRVATPVNPTDDVVTIDPSTSPFGRKFEIITFRWLNEKEL